MSGVSAEQWKARAELAAEVAKDALARLAKVEALCDSHGPSPHHTACHRCASLIRDILDLGGTT